MLDSAFCCKCNFIACENDGMSDLNSCHSSWPATVLCRLQCDFASTNAVRMELVEECRLQHDC